MRIVLQQKESGLYLKDLNAWVRAGSEAMDFLSSTAALDFCRTHKLAGLQVVLKFEEEKYEIVLPAQARLLAAGTGAAAPARLPT